MNALILTIIFPIIAFILLAFSHGRLSENLSAAIGTGSVGLTALITTYVSIDFYNNECQPFRIPLWTWMSVNDFCIDFSLMLDTLSMIMLSVITSVGFLIHIFSSWYMRGKEGYSRFFAYTNLFIANMVILVLADNLLTMYLGWEGVGLCSYLLIGFYYTNPKNGKAAIKSFIMTRIGDVLLAFALFILYAELGTLNFCKMIELALEHFKEDNRMLLWVTLMLLGGAVGKSAQLPLQTWLADAMVGPTPVSAMIHASTMVTAGVYLIARTHSLFLMTPEILHLVSIIGAVTLVLAGFAALVQIDIKRILAYSTMSQIGYMFMALGVQAWNAAIFHLITHAFFKALLFLSSGAVILACHHEKNIFKMGGLRHSIPLIYVCFLVGGSALSALPLITSGFFSKDAILEGVMAHGHTNLMITGLIGAFITSLYTFRMIFTVFHGKEQIYALSEKSIAYRLPLIALLILSTFVGAMIVPPLKNMFPNTILLEYRYALILKIISSIVVIAGILIAARLWLGKGTLVTTIANSTPGRSLGLWCYSAFGFDWLYDVIFVKSFLYIVWLVKRDPLNTIINILAILSRLAGTALLLSENGYLHWYVASMSIGGIIILVMLMILH